MARADVIMLRGGGQVQGKVVPDPQNKDRVQVWLLQGRKPLSFQKAQIVEVIPKASPLDDYFEKSKKTPQTAQAQYDLGIWCEQNKLTDLARLHYEAALAIDKSFEPAHRKLGHVYHDGYWLTRDDLSAVQGLVKYKGRWISAEEKAKRQAEEEATRHAGVVAAPDQDVAAGDRERSRRPPARGGVAVDGHPRAPKRSGRCCAFWVTTNPPQRILLAQVLSAIPGKEATVGAGQADLGRATRRGPAVIFEKLKDRDDPAWFPRLVRALTSSDIQVINRAAWTLGNLGAVEVGAQADPGALTTEQQIVMVPPEQRQPAGDRGARRAHGTPRYEQQRHRSPDAAGRQPGSRRLRRDVGALLCAPVRLRHECRGSDRQPAGTSRRDLHLSQRRSPRGPRRR